MNNYGLSFWLALVVFFFTNCKSSQQDAHTYTNALINESSPYLLQHAHNPVNWYPWGEEALAKAQEEDKLLIISVGYAACHWCHVMEHESFEDTTVARIMNEHFVSIKVDREERPDVDDVYMTACQLATDKGCGWPLNAIALPDGRPIWAGTYFPRNQWMEVLAYFIKEKADKGDEIDTYANRLTETINQIGQLAAVDTKTTLELSMADSFAKNMLAGIDHRRGGRKGAPKFPLPDNYQWLHSYSFYTANEEARQVWQTTLENLAAGGIYDHLGGGFARYSTDSYWLVPHFEKMLYDNSQLVSLYAKAYSDTGNENYRNVIEETLAFVEREMTDAEGHFYASLDADSDGEEGKFYVWHTNEIDSLLTDEEAGLFKAYYQLKNKGNWEEGKNILHTSLSPGSSPSAVLAQYDQSEELLKSAKEKLFAARSQRIRPGLDDKAITSWNALMIIAYTDAAAALARDDYLQKAIVAAQHIVDNNMEEDGQLWRIYKDGKASINGFLDDYAFTAQAFLRLYELTFNETWLRNAEQLIDYAVLHFSNTESDLYYYTSDLDPALVSRRMEIQDNVIAGSNSAMAEALWQLSIYLDREDYKESVDRMLSALLQEGKMLDNPSFFANWGQLLLNRLYPPFEVAVVGPNWKELSDELHANYLPHALLLGGSSEGSLSLLKNKLVADETFIYVCQNKVCKLPVQRVEEALRLMN